MDSFSHLPLSQRGLTMSGTDASLDPRSSIGFRETQPIQRRGAMPVVHSQMVVDRWYTPSSAHYDSTTRPSPQFDVYFDPRNRVTPPLGLKREFSPTFLPQLHHEEMEHAHRTESTLSPHSTQEQPTPLHLNPLLLANGSTDNTGDARQFLWVRPDSRYECLLDDGSGKRCGHLGTLLQVKRHLCSDHRLNRYVFGHQSTLNASVISRDLSTGRPFVRPARSPFPVRTP